MASTSVKPWVLIMMAGDSIEPRVLIMMAGTTVEPWILLTMMASTSVEPGILNYLAYKLPLVMRMTGTGVIRSCGWHQIKLMLMENNLVRKKIFI